MGKTWEGVFCLLSGPQEKGQVTSTCLCEPWFILLEMGKLEDYN